MTAGGATIFSAKSLTLCGGELTFSEVDGTVRHFAVIRSPLQSLLSRKFNHPNLLVKKEKPCLTN
jgi:hypothetical protein